MFGAKPMVTFVATQRYEAMNPMLRADFVKSVMRQDMSCADHAARLLIGYFIAFVSFFARLMTWQIHPQPAIATASLRGGAQSAGPLSLPFMIRPLAPLSLGSQAALLRVKNGKQNVDRCIPSGRNPGGGAQR